MSDDFKTPYRHYTGRLILPENTPTQYQNLSGQYQPTSATELLSVRDKIVEDCNKYTDTMFTTTLDKVINRLMGYGALALLVTGAITYFGWLKGFQDTVKILEAQQRSVAQNNTILLNEQKLLNEKMEFILKHIVKGKD